MPIINFHLPFKPLHLEGVLLYRDLQDTGALVLQHMEVALGELMSSDVMGIVVVGTVVVGTAVVGADMILPVGSYLYVQQPCLEVHNNEVAEQ